jgi:hypothetical protein
MPYLDLVAPVVRVDGLEVVFHNETLIRYLRLLHTSVHDVTGRNDTDENEAKGDPIADPRLLHSWVVNPWLFTSVTRQCVQVVRCREGTYSPRSL